jgi:hypothetical protein
MPALHGFGVVELFNLRPGSQVIRRRHRETVGNQIGAAQGSG